MEKFEINTHIKVDLLANLDVLETFKEDLNKHIGNFVIVDSFKKRILIINGTIKKFIDYFELPNTLSSVILSFSQDIGCSPLLIEEKITTFFKALVRTKILVKEGCSPKILNVEPCFEVNDRFEEFIIKKLIAKKTKVEVYLAEQNQKEIAIKFLPSSNFNDPQEYFDTIELLKHEYLTSKALESIQGTCNSLEFKQNDEFTYIVMEYVEGLVLSEYIKINKSTTLTEKASLIRSILNSFSSIHSMGIIHGDIHARNFIVLPSNQIKVIDFGLSINVLPEENEIVKSGGVPAYMPPERISNRFTNRFIKDADFHSEVYQLGIVMYLILYNKMPFTGFTWSQLADLIITASPNFNNDTFNNEPINEYIILFIKKALSKEKMERYNSAVEMYEEWKKMESNILSY